MDQNQRKVFWDTLVSLDGKDIEAESEKLKQAVVYPRYLYRYRPINMKSLDALRKNHLYFSTANYYDDPFDTFIHIDLGYIERVFQSLNDNTDNEQLIDAAKQFFGFLIPDGFDENAAVNMIQGLKNAFADSRFHPYVMDFFRNIRNEVKKEIWSACFSENAFNETLWLKYAQQHKGFSIQYDLTKPELLMCGQQDKCENCGVNKYGFSLYPVYYSDEQYDGTRFAQFVTYKKLFSEWNGMAPELKNEMFRRFAQGFGNVNWERERIALIKKACHQYDEEWRFILNANMNGPVMCEWKPTAVILGLNMGEAEKGLTVAAAKEAGIENIWQSYIDDQGRLNCGAI